MSSFEKFIPNPDTHVKNEELSPYASSKQNGGVEQSESRGEDIGNEKEKKDQSAEDLKKQNEQKSEQQREFRQNLSVQEQAAKKMDPPPTEAEMAMMFNDFPPSPESDEKQSSNVDGANREKSV